MVRRTLQPRTYMDLYSFLLGLVVGLQILFVPIGAYCFWRFSYRPFVAVRKDVVALNEFVTALQRAQELATQELAQRKAITLSDPHVAALEAREARLRLLHNTVSAQ